jgi:transglutaminase-like putative cysteine protease
VGAHFHNPARRQNPALAAAFLASTDVVDWYHADVRTLAWYLAGGESDLVEVARRSFEWVRDEIRHSVDCGDSVVTCTASEVLTQRTGLCYAKSHLLAALLRANGIPTGFCYQRLSQDGVGPPFCLHGLNALWLSAFGWFRVDARGNRPGSGISAVEAKFTPMQENLAFAVRIEGETMLPEILADPRAEVVGALRRFPSVAELCENLPDWSEVSPAVAR